MQERVITIQIYLDSQSSRLESSLGVDIESLAQNWTEEERIIDLLQALCLAFEVHPRGTYSQIWN